MHPLMLIGEPNRFTEGDWQHLVHALRGEEPVELTLIVDMLPLGDDHTADVKQMAAVMLSRLRRDFPMASVEIGTHQPGPSVPCTFIVRR